MISVIVSSYKPDLFLQFQKNLTETIGDVPFEVIKIDNPGMKGICEAYNEGATKAQYPYLVFSHEDILFRTTDWGIIVRQIFEQDGTIGLVGAIGGNYKSLSYTGWAIHEKYASACMIGTHHGVSYLNKTYKGNSSSVLLHTNQPIPKRFIEQAITNEPVLMLDGMFLITKKTIHDQIPFDQSTFKGFHCYDIDYSLQLNGAYKVVVNHNILIEHFSAGNFDLKWIRDMTLFNKKWERHLPCSLHPYTDSQKRELEFNCLEINLRLYKDNHLPLTHLFKVIFYFPYIQGVGFTNWLWLMLKLLRKVASLGIKAGFTTLSRLYETRLSTRLVANQQKT